MELKINHVIRLQESVIVTREWLGEAAVVVDTIAGVSVLANHVGVKRIGPLMMEDVIRLISNTSSYFYTICL